jgi:acyl-CoA thioesterase
VTHDQADGSRDDASQAADAMDRALRSAARMHADDQVVKALQISINEVAPGRATARMRVTADMVNGHGIAHGGYVFLLADAAFAYACNTHGPATVARQCEITFLSPARAGDDLIAVATERVRIERNGIYDISIRRASGDVLAEMRGHSRTVRPGPGTDGNA